MRSRLLLRSRVWRFVFVGGLVLLSSLQLAPTNAVAITPWEECNNECWAIFSADMAMCRRYVNIQDEEICTWFYSQHYDACRQRCDDVYGDW